MNTRNKQQVPTTMDSLSNATGRSNTRGPSGLAAFRRARSLVAVSQSPSAPATSQLSQPQPQPQQPQSQQRTPAQPGWKPKAKNPFGFNRPPLEPPSSTTSKGAATANSTATQAPKTKLTKVVEEPSLSSCSSSTSVQNNNNNNINNNKNNRNNNSNNNNNNSKNNSQRGTATVNPLAKYHTIDDSAQCQAALVAKLENVEFDRRRAMSETLATQRPKQSSGGVPNTGPGASSLLRRRFLFFGSSAGGSSSNTAKNGQQPPPPPPPQQAKVDTNEIKQVVKNENEALKARVARLEMDQVELKALRHKITQLEWALDVVREDADKVRDDARSLLMQLQQHGKHDREWDEFDEERDASTVGKDHVNDDISRTPIPHH